MSLLDEYKKRQKENKQVTNNNLFYELKQRKALETQKDIISRMNSWNNNSSAFVNEFKNRFYDKDGNYIDSFRSDTNDALKRANIQKNYLDTERESLSKILKEYESFYDENWVKNIRLQLANGHFGQDKIIESYVSNNNLFSQFENADEFDKWLAQQKKDEELRKTDLNYTKNQITVLELDFERMQNLRNKENELSSKLSTKEYALKEQNRRADLTVDPKLKKEVETLRAELDATKAEYAQLSTTLGNADDIASRLNSLRDTYEQAKEFQETEALTTDALNAPDLEEFSQKGKQWGQETYQGGFLNLGTYNNDQIIYYRENPTDMMKDSAERLRSGSYSEDNVKASNFAAKMTEDEYKVYTYYVGKGDKEKAKKYLDSISETITAKMAGEFYDANLKDASTAEKILFGFAAGIGQFGEGLKNLFDTESDEFDPSYMQMVSAQVREDLKDESFNVWYNFSTGEWEDKINGNSLGQTAYDLTTTTGNMLPSIITSAVVGYINPVAGQIVGSTLMGASASGNAYAEMVNLGYDKDQARAYSALVGGSEAGLQYLLGGIGKLGGSVSSKAISSAVSKIDNVFARAAIQLGGSMISEGAEEYLQEVLDPFFKNIAFGEDNDIRFISEEALYSGLLGALSAGVLEGGSTVGGNVSTYKTGKQLKAAGVTAEQLSELGSKLSVDSEAYKLAGRVNENTGAYTLGRLFNEIGAEISAQNKSDIKAALQARGVNSRSASTIADWMGKVVAGAELTSEQIAAIEENPVIGEVAREVLFNQNSTPLQRQIGYDNVSEQLELHEFKQQMDKIEKKNAKKAKKNATTEESATAPVVGDDFVPLTNEATKAALEGIDTETQNAPKWLSKTEMNNSSTENTNAPKSQFNASSEGKTIDTNTGEEIGIKEIASIKDGVMTLRTQNDETVNAKDVDFGSEDEALIYSAVLDMNVPTEVANAIVDGYIPSEGMSVSKYIMGADHAYRYGYMGISEAEMLADEATEYLTEGQKQRLYNIGKATAKAETSKEQAEIDSKKTQKSKNKAKKKGRVTFDGKELSKEFEDSLTDIQRESIKGIKVIAEALGNDVNLFASYIAKEGLYKGKRVYKDSNGNVKLAPNGFYNPDGSINLDINSGNLGEGTMLYTLSHELTHHIRKWSPAKFKVLADFVVEQYSDNGIKIKDLVYEQMAKAKKNGRSIRYGTAYEEVIADACSTMLLDSNAIEKLAQKDKTLFEKIKSFIKDFIDKINKLYKNFSPDAKEAQYVKDIKGMTDKLQALWFEGLEDASEAYSSAMGESSLVNIDADSKSIAPMFSERTWTQSEYVTERENTAKAISESLGVDIQTAYKYIDDINSVARLIADDRVRLDYEPNLDDKATVLKPNSDYKYTVDMSTLCAKRLVFTGTFDAIQKALPNTVFDSDDIVRLREMMMERGYEVACGICYVESTRREIGRITQDFIDSYKESQKTGKPITRTNSEGKIVELKKTNEQKKTTADKSTDKFYAEKDYTPTLGDLNTTDIDIVKREHPLVYEAYLNFMNARGQSKPKLLETRAEYKGEILKSFKSKNAVDARNRAGGLRLQSFSDFEVPHLIDMMQVVMDMSRVGLKSQAYTKIPKFAEAFGNTGVKINLSLIAKGSGLDSNGNLVFDDVEGINHKEAFKLREKFSKNVGTILVGKNNEHIIAAMADPRIDFIIPFHKSSWKESLYEALGLTGYDDYTETQHEKPVDKSRKISDFDPSEYWDYSKTGDENAQIYLQKCKEDGRTPKFPQFQNYRGYWKLLIDFKMYDNDGVGSPQEVVQPIFDSKVNEKILSEYKGGHRSFPVAKDVVKDFVEQHSDNADTILYSDRDSDGNMLSKEQQEFFKDSKVRDKDGNLLVMYHGTPNAGFTKFKSGTYFTQHKWYADRYKSQGASSLGVKKTADNPDTYAVYLNIKKPFDTRNKTERDIFYNEYYRQWGTGTDLMESGLPDWMDGMDLQEFLEENGYDYDGLILDEGGVGGYGEEVKSRGLSYVAFSSEQVKNIDNKAPTSDPDIRYSGRGNGYDGYSMSNNARAAYAEGEKPISKWNKTDILDAVKEINPDVLPLIKNVNVAFLKEHLLYKSSWHHTSNHYNKTDFYSVDEKAVNGLTKEVVSSWVKTKPEAKPNNIYKGDITYLEWGGTRNHPTADEYTLRNVNIEEKGAFYIVTNDNGKQLLRKKIGSNGTKVTRYDEIGKFGKDKFISEKEQKAISEAKDIYEKLYVILDSRKTKYATMNGLVKAWKNGKVGMEDYQQIMDFYDQELQRKMEQWKHLPKEHWNHEIIENYKTNKLDTLKKQFGFWKIPSNEKVITEIKNTLMERETNSPMFSDRDPDGGFSKRYLLANALESTAKTAEDKKKLVEYKAKLGKLSEVQQRLQDVNAKIKEISFGKGKRDKVKLAELQKTSKELNDLINRYDKKLLSLESTESLKQVLEREKKTAYKKAAQEGKEALADYQEKAKQREQDIRTKYQESRKTAIDKRHQTQMRHKIQKVIMELDGMLRHGTKEKNIKVGLQKVVADAVQAINADTVKLEALRKAYADIRYGKSEDVPAYYMEEAAQIEQKIDEVIDLVGDTPMSEMSLEQLNSVYDMYRMVLTTVRNANKVWRAGKLEDLQQNANAVMTELDMLPKLKEERAAIFEKMREFAWNEMIPAYAFERLGSGTFKKFFWDTINAQNVLAEDIAEAKTFADAVREKYNYEKWDRSEIHEFKLKDGRIFRMNLGHMMSVYAYSKRDQAIPHMTTGGFFFNDRSTFRKKGGVLKIIKSTEEGYKVDVDMLAEIKDAMPKEVVDYVDEMQDYLTKMGEKGNEVSRVIWGIDIFKEKVYFPLKSVRDFVFQSNQPTQEVSLKNDGMTKETKPNASNPIVLEDFDDIWASHVNRMSQYHAFVIPIDNINKIHNYGTWAGTSSVAVSTMIKGRFGEAANEYISQFIRDLNGGVSTKGASNPFMSLFGKFKKTAVAASTSVVVQQPTAILRATAIVDPKYFVGKPNIHMAKEYEQLKKYAPIAIIKEIGGFDAGAGRQISSWLNSDTQQGLDKVMQKIDDVSMLGAAWGDILGWCTIWDAVKREVKANNNGIDTNSEEFLKKAGERFTEVIVYTQVYDSTLSRSGFMRSKHDSVKMLTAFMGEPTVSINMMYNAVLQAKRGGKGARIKAARTIGAVYLSQIAASAAASAIYALRDDDEDETYIEKFGEAWSDKMLGSYGLTGELNPLTQLPAVRDIISIFDGWDIERTDMAVFKDVKDALDGLFSDNKSAWRKIEDFSGAIASLFGLPVKNILRTGREMYNAVNAIFSDVEGGSFGEAFVRGMTGEEKSKPNKLYDAIVNGNEEMLKILREGYDDDAAYENAVRKALRENDPRIKDAAEAGYNGDVTERVRIAKEIIAEGNFSQDIVIEAINAEINAIKKELDSEEDETEDVEEKKSIYSTKDISTALEDGDAALAKEIIADIVSVKVEKYMAKDEDLKQKEAEKKAKTSVKSSLSEYWKKLYVEAYNAKDTDEMKRIRFVLKDTGLYGTANDIISTCNNWVKESRKK